MTASKIDDVIAAQREEILDPIKAQPVPAKAAAPSQSEVYLKEIRDALVKQKSGK